MTSFRGNFQVGFADGFIFDTSYIWKLFLVLVTTNTDYKILLSRKINQLVIQKTCATISYAEMMLFLIESFRFYSTQRTDVEYFFTCGNILCLEPFLSRRLFKNATNTSLQASIRDG